jgi:tetratricopeptide (TPR) repeat protein
MTMKTLMMESRAAGGLMAIGSSALVALALCGAPALAQSFATVHGHVTNPIGQPFTNGEVKFTKDRDQPFDKEKFTNTIPIDAEGNYKATDIAPGDYFVIVVQGDKAAYKLDLSVHGGDNKTLDFDMTSADYVKGMSEEQKKALEEYKKKNAEVMSANKVIEGLNATLKTVRADLTEAATTKGDVSKDVASMKAATDAKPEAAILWLTYGDTLQTQADHVKAEDKKSGKSPATDDDLTKLYSDSADAYKKADTLDKAAAKPNLPEDAVVLNQMGNVLGKAGKFDEAIAAFEGAAKADPPSAGKFYKNEAVILLNNNKNDEALAAAEKAIAADPTLPYPYYIKGQALIGKSTFDSKTNTMSPPPGCVEAYEKFVQLAPNDPNVPQVKELLATLGEKIDKTYKAPKK